MGRVKLKSGSEPDESEKRDTACGRVRNMKEKNSKTEIEVRRGNVKRPAKKKNIIKIVIVLVVLAALGVGAYFAKDYIKKIGKMYDTYSLTSETGINSGGSSTYVLGEGCVIRYTRDGISAYNEKGSEIWNVAYTMTKPIVDVCDSYAAVADKGANTCYILDGSGKVHNLTTEHKIENVSVSGKGVAAIWMDDGSKDYISLYDKEGKRLGDIMTTTLQDGIPLAFDLSPDGTKLVTSYIILEDNKMKNQLTFYNFSDMGSNYVDRLVGLVAYTDRLNAVVRFAGNNTVAAFSEKGIDVFGMEVTEDEKKKIVYAEENIEQISVEDGHIGVITRTDGGMFKLHVYDKNGNPELERELDRRYEKFSLSGKDVILYGGSSLYIVKLNGKDKANVNLSMEIKGVVPVDGKKKYIIMGEQKLQTIELKVRDTEKQ